MSRPNYPVIGDTWEDDQGLTHVIKLPDNVSVVPLYAAIRGYVDHPTHGVCLLWGRDPANMLIKGSINPRESDWNMWHTAHSLTPITHLVRRVAASPYPGFDVPEMLGKVTFLAHKHVCEYWFEDYTYRGVVEVVARHPWAKHAISAIQILDGLMPRPSGPEFIMDGGAYYVRGGRRRIIIPFDVAKYDMRNGIYRPNVVWRDEAFVRESLTFVARQCLRRAEAAGLKLREPKCQI
jgi:hypothetical protein